MVLQGAPPPGFPSPRAHEEKIFVTVRVRPLSRQEVAANDREAWQCVDKKTLLYTEPIPEKTQCLFPKSYTFDRVFGPSCPSEQVYVDAARDVVLSSLNGLNATIFAYGQTSSGKTYTMRGVTEKAVHDIFHHIAQTPNREFLMRISALEIYNEVVKDLLRPDNGALRLLDDPERGTVVEKLTEELVRSAGHLQQILHECESQRQVADTMLNDASSRSHQIIRLTVESCPRGPLSASTEAGQVLVSSLNFVDLAGSERASQTLAEGTRLKEGGHINRSLLTLGTVIRKLSSKRSGKDHIPYRDSKLTRILQHSLGGNARTAIICTLSPALGHVEQSRNTLAFALRATEVTNTAQVNLVVSDKVLIKQLQREVARLEAELAVAQEHVSVGLQHRDQRIQEIEMQMHEVCSQRDSAQERVRELTKLIIRSEKDAKMDEHKSWSPDTVKRLLRRSGLRRKGGRLAPSEENSVESTPAALGSTGRFLEYRELRERRRERERREREKESAMLEKEKKKLESMHEQMGAIGDQAVDALQKEIECLRVAQAKDGGNYSNLKGLVEKLQADLDRLQAGKHEGRAEEVNSSKERMVQMLREELQRLQRSAQADEKADQDIATLEANLESAQKSLDKFCDHTATGEETPGTAHQGRKVFAPKSPLAPPAILGRPSSPSSPRALKARVLENDENYPLVENSGEDSKQEAKKTQATSLDIRRMQKMFKTAAEENVKSIKNYVTELKERISKLQYQKQLLLCQVLELEAAAKRSASEYEDFVPSEGWALRLEEQASAIIQLWDMCNVSVVHRTHFYVMFSSAGPQDHVYLEVEHRRLEWLREQCLATLEEGEEEPGAIRGSLKALHQERHMLVRRMREVLSPPVRDQLFIEWGIDPASKQRKQQLACLLWSDPYDRKLVKDSAELVARLLGLSSSGRAPSKELFGLQYADRNKPSSWMACFVPNV